MTKYPQTALLLVDIQKGFDDSSYWGSPRSNPLLEKNVEQLLSAFRSSPFKPLMIHVQHNSKNPKSPLHSTSPGVEFQEISQPLPSEVVIKKNVNSAFIGTDLETILRERSIRRLYICGITTDQCVSTTTRMAANLCVCDQGDEKGDVVLVGDCTAAFGYAGFESELIHKVHEVTLAHEFCRLVDTATAVKEIAQ